MYVRMMCCEEETCDRSFSASGLVGAGMKEVVVGGAWTETAVGAAEFMKGAVVGRTAALPEEAAFIACSILSCRSLSRWRTRRTVCSCFDRGASGAGKKSTPFLRGSMNEKPEEIGLNSWYWLWGT